jgi:uncharacterized protein
LINESRPHSLPAPRSSDEIAFDESAQSLCLACGLCCDGTLFDKAPLERNDEDDKLLALGIEIISGQNGRALKLPCPAHKNCRCTVYTERPTICRTFRCKLLKRFKANEISKTEALEIIREAVTHRDDENK